MTKKNKKGFEFGFSWIFVIIVGAAILFLAIYFAVKFVGTSKDVKNTQIAYEVNNLLIPVVTNLDETRTSGMKFNVNTRFYNNCGRNGNFGYQAISISTKSEIGEKWSKPAEQARAFDKYIFSSSVEEGKELEFFPKSFNMPFKIGDLIFLWSKNDRYCFVNPWNEIKEDLELFKSESINITDSLSECSKESIKVCFGNEVCDIKVEENRVRKDKKSLYYYDSLVYGAIFADHEIYECQVERLMKRAFELSLLYREKSDFLDSNGCSSGLREDLIIYANRTILVNESSKLISIQNMAEVMEMKNDDLYCELWGKK